MEPLKSPYVYFGGKKRIASTVWDYLGNVPNYIEPFFGSGAILLNRPNEPNFETINDLDCHIANFWRAIKFNAEEVAEHADSPVIEADMYAKHTWIINQKEFRERIAREPYFFDAKLAGWWVWGINIWLGADWCKIPENSNSDINKEILSRNGSSVLAQRGVNSEQFADGKIYQIFKKLQNRFRKVHVMSGDWSRCITPTWTYKYRGITGVLLDPPYGEGKMNYAAGGNNSESVSKKVQNWAVENGDNPLMRIIYCGYEGQFNPPSSWRIVEWKSQGGFSVKGSEAEENSSRERLWLSPHCLAEKQNTLFDIGKNDSGLVVRYCEDVKKESKTESIPEKPVNIPAFHNVKSEVEISKENTENCNRDSKSLSTSIQSNNESILHGKEIDEHEEFDNIAQENPNKIKTEETKKEFKPVFTTPQGKLF